MSAPPIPETSAPARLAHPTADDFNWLAKRQLGNAVAHAARHYAGGRLLDVGCGSKPYREVFAPYVSEHVGVDHADSPHGLESVDVAATAYDIPLPSHSFDTVLMSELLEHLEAPGMALAEAHRLLAPGGWVILTTPFMWVVHEQPRDFFRYSPYGLRYLLEQAGFESIDVLPVAGQWSTWGILTSYALKQSSLRWRIGDPARRLARAAQHVGSWLDRRNFRPWMSYDHLAVGRKPAAL
jgi:ubiquinone/menaquinone biosynthesis C-methylase UbiE